MKDIPHLIFFLPFAENTAMLGGWMYLQRKILGGINDLYNKRKIFPVISGTAAPQKFKTVITHQIMKSFPLKMTVFNNTGTFFSVVNIPRLTHRQLAFRQFAVEFFCKECPPPDPFRVCRDKKKGI